MHVDTSASEFTEYRTLALSDAKVVGGFWSQRQAVNRQSSLNHAFEKLEASGNFNNLKLASGEGEGAYREPLFMDSDIYKWLEAVGYALANEPDAELQAKAEYAIGLLARAQEPDGYLNSYYQVLKPELKWLELAHGHELYCAGHLFEAAVAYHRGTGNAACSTSPSSLRTSSTGSSAPAGATARRDTRRSNWRWSNWPARPARRAMPNWPCSSWGAAGRVR